MTLMAASTVAAGSAVFAQDDLLFVSALCHTATYGACVLTTATYTNLIDRLSGVSTSLHRMYSHKKQASISKIGWDTIENHHRLDNTHHAARDCACHHASSVLSIGSLHAWR